MIFDPQLDKGQRILPIIYKPEMANQIYLGNKWITRRPFKFHKRNNLFPDAPNEYDFGKASHTEEWRGLMHKEIRSVLYRPHRDTFAFYNGGGEMMFEVFDDEMPQPYGQRGDIHWIRESFSIVGLNEQVDFQSLTPKRVANRHALKLGKDYNVLYKPDHDPNHIKWKPSIYMPRAFARGFVRVLNVRIETLSKMVELDAKAEGMETPTRAGKEGKATLLKSFNYLWDCMYKDTHFESKHDPLVWVIEFSQLRIPERPDFVNYYGGAV